MLKSFFFILIRALISLVDQEGAKGVRLNLPSGPGTKLRYMGYFESLLHYQEEKLGYYYQSGTCLGALETHVLLSFLWSIFCKWPVINVTPLTLKIVVYKVSKGAKIRSRYNQVPHPTQDTNGKITNSQLDTTNESQEVSPFPAGDHKAHINRRAQRHRTKT